MNIFSVLFGTTKLPAVSSNRASHFDSYLARERVAISGCTDVSELTDYSKNRSGFLREAAISRCLELAWPELLPIVASRLNDWVPQVRQSARSAMMTLIPLVPGAQILANLPNVLRLHHAGRTDHSDWLIEFEKNLIRFVSMQELINGVQGRDIKVARACFLILKKHSLIEAPSLISMIIARNDDIVLAGQAIYLCAELPQQAQQTQYQSAMSSHFGTVRTIALRASLELDIESKREIAIAALFDFQSSVRSVAMEYLQRNGFDTRAYIRHALEAPTLSAKLIQVGLASLASLGHADDVELIKTFINAERPSVRQAALAAWLKLSIMDKDVIATAAVMDVAQGVRKFALQAVRKYGAFIPFDQVRATLEASGDARLLLRFAEMNKWNWLECIARFAMQADLADALRIHLFDALQDWLRYSTNRYETPSTEQAIFLLSEPAIAALNKLLGNDHVMDKRLALDLPKR